MKNYRYEELPDKLKEIVKHPPNWMRLCFSNTYYGMSYASYIVAYFFGTIHEWRDVFIKAKLYNSQVETELFVMLMSDSHEAL